MSKNISPRFIFIVGGVISGLGKGVFTASLGKVLKMAGYKVNIVKIDPYLNTDAGTMRPTEHGEVWVTYDGGEIDQDLGNYERFLHQKFSKNNNITSGKILKNIIQAERSGKYLGKTIQYIPHVTNYIAETLVKNHKKSKADITLVEIGGTVGDYESSLFLHTLARIQNTYKIATVFMGYLLKPPHINEIKTKPYQHALMLLMQYGIKPDLYIARAPTTFHKDKLEKIAAVANTCIENIIALPDTSNIYEIPKLLYKNPKAIKNLLTKLGMQFPKKSRFWANQINKYNNFFFLLNKINKNKKAVNIAIVGKYTKAGNFILKDSYISVVEAIYFAAWQNKVKPNIVWIDAIDLEKANRQQIKQIFKNIHAIIVPGGFGTKGVIGKIKAINYARTNKIPYLGLCYGLQLAVIEFARNVIGLKNSNSTEIDPSTPEPVIDILPDQKKILAQNQYGASMRLGEYKAYLVKNTIVYNLYKQANRLYKDKFGAYVVERHRHRYEVNPKYHEILKQHALVFSGMSKDKTLVEFIELPQRIHPYFVATQAHPEFTSYPEDPNPLFVGLIRAAKKHAQL